MPPESKPPRRFWGWCRCSFRWFRISALALLLLILLALTWLRLAGLPDFVRQRLVDELEERGVTADFASLHFQWFRGLVATDLHATWGGTNGPRIRIAEADLDIAPPPWRYRRELIRGLSVRSGTLVLPLPLPNEPLAKLVVERVSADLRFLPGDAWDVRRLSAEVLGLNLELRATITNVTALRTPRAPSDPTGAAHRVRLVRSVVEEVAHWTTPQAPQAPRLEVNLRLDGLQPEAAEGDAYLVVPEVRTPHGDLRNLRTSLRILPSQGSTNAPARSSLMVEFADLQTAQGGVSGFSARWDFTGPPRPALFTNVAWQATAQQVFLHGFRARDLSLAATNDLLAPPTGVTRADLAALPLRSQLTLRARQIEAGSLQGEPLTASGVLASLFAEHSLSTNLPGQVRVAADIDHLSGVPGRTGALRTQVDLALRPDPGTIPPNLAGWRWLWPYAGSVELSLAEALLPDRLAVERLDLAVDWQPPLARLDRLDAALYGGRLESTGSLDVASREARISATTTFDLHGIDPLLSPKGRENFDRYQWQTPPWVEASARALLPPWNDPRPDWRATVKPTVQGQARIKVGAGGFKGVDFDTAESSLSFDGTLLRLPDIRTSRPEGTQQVAVEYNVDTREYRVDAIGTVHPPVLRPLIGEKSAEVLDLFEFKQPVAAVVSVWGPWSEGDSQSIIGTVQATNLIFRSQGFDRLEATVTYTNRFLLGTGIRLHRDGAELTARSVGYNFETDHLALTNVVSRLDPRVVAAAISPGFPEKLKHYRFDTPPLGGGGGPHPPPAPRPPARGL